MTLVVGQGFQNTLGLGLGGQDAFDRRRGISAETNRAVEGGDQVFAGVAAQQRQHAPRLTFAVTLIAQQAIEEATCRCA